MTSMILKSITKKEDKMKLRSSLLVALAAAAITLLIKNYYDDSMAAKKSESVCYLQTSMKDLINRDIRDMERWRTERIIDRAYEQMRRVSSDTIVDRSLRDLSMGRDSGLEILTNIA